MVDQTYSTGARDYASFFNSSSKIVYNSNHPDIPLYQAQHGTLYYQLVRPLFMLSGGINNPSQSTAVLRLVNLIFVVFSLMTCFWFIHRVTNNSSQAALLMIMLACQPLVLINACRVANDALAVVLGTLVIIITLEKNWYDRKWLIVLISLFLGLGIWVKITNLPLGLFVLLSLMLALLRKTISVKRAAGVGCTVLILTMMASSPNIIFNLRRYGTLTPMIEVMLKQTHANGDSETAAPISKRKIVKTLRRVWTRNSTWTGGWSFLTVINATNLLAYLLYLAIAGWIFHLLHRWRQPLLFPIDVSILFFLLVLSISAALGWKLIQSYRAWGLTSTNAWYACVGLPFFLSLAYEGAGRWSRWGATIFGWLMVGSYLFVEIYGALTKMLPTYSGGAKGLEAIRRIALFHPGWLGMETMIIASILCIALFFLITFAWLKDAGLLFQRWKKA